MALPPWVVKFIDPFAAYLDCGLTRKRMELAGSGVTWTGSLEGVFRGKKTS
jgi:hypothetical protein